MIRKQNNFAYIDGANLHNGILSLNWNIDYKKFRIWLKEKYGVTQAYLFIGLVPTLKHIYTNLEAAGFILICKEITYGENGKIKGNCDADLVLKTAIDAFENSFEKAVIVTSDGDYCGLIKFLLSKNKLECILSPRNPDKCSALLRRTKAKISYINDQRTILAKNEKAPDEDGTS